MPFLQQRFYLSHKVKGTCKINPGVFSRKFFAASNAFSTEWYSPMFLSVYVLKVSAMLCAERALPLCICTTDISVNRRLSVSSFTISV